jgi:hypothetical protein
MTDEANTVDTLEFLETILEESLISSSYQNIAKEDRLRYFKLARRALLQVLQEAGKFFPLEIIKMTTTHIVSTDNGFLELKVPKLNMIGRVEYKMSGRHYIPLEKVGYDAFLDSCSIRGIHSIPHIYTVIYTVPLTIWVSPIASGVDFNIYGKTVVNKIAVSMKDEVVDEKIVTKIVAEPGTLTLPYNPNLENYISLKAAYICAILANSTVTEERRAAMIDAKKMLFATTDRIETTPHDMLCGNSTFGQYRYRAELLAMAGSW